MRVDFSLNKLKSENYKLWVLRVRIFGLKVIPPKFACLDFVCVCVFFILVSFYSSTTNFFEDRVLLILDFLTCTTLDNSFLVGQRGAISRRQQMEPTRRSPQSV